MGGMGKGTPLPVVFLMTIENHGQTSLPMPPNADTQLPLLLVHVLRRILLKLLTARLAAEVIGLAVIGRGRRVRRHRHVHARQVRVILADQTLGMWSGRLAGGCQRRRTRWR